MLIGFCVYFFILFFGCFMLVSYFDGVRSWAGVANQLGAFSADLDRDGRYLLSLFFTV